jgi:hypothetical protein
MSQHIGIKLLNQKNETIKDFDLNLSMFIYNLKKREGLDYPLLYSIDEYDNTCFNKNQCEIATKELEKMLTENKFIDIKEDINKLITILSTIERYQYILFIGD